MGRVRRFFLVNLSETQKYIILQNIISIFLLYQGALTPEYIVFLKVRIDRSTVLMDPNEILTIKCYLIFLFNCKEIDEYGLLSKIAIQQRNVVFLEYFGKK